MCRLKKLALVLLVFFVLVIPMLACSGTESTNDHQVVMEVQPTQVDCSKLQGQDGLNAAHKGLCPCPPTVANWGMSSSPSGACEDAYGPDGNLKPNYEFSP